jgi:hypothetical protein
VQWSGVAAVAAVASYEHAYALVRAHGEAGSTGRLVPLTVDGLIYVSSTVMLDSARRDVRVPALARWLLGLGTVATLASNVAHGLGHGSGGVPDPLQQQAAEVFAGHLAAARVPSIRAIRIQFHVGQPPGAAAAPGSKQFGPTATTSATRQAEPSSSSKRV